MDPLFLTAEVHHDGDCVIIGGGRDGLVTLRSAIDEALVRGQGVADVAGDKPEDERTVTVHRLGS